MNECIVFFLPSEYYQSVVFAWALRTSIIVLTIF